MKVILGILTINLAIFGVYFVLDIFSVLRWTKVVANFGTASTLNALQKRLFNHEIFSETGKWKAISILSKYAAYNIAANIPTKHEKSGNFMVYTNDDNERRLFVYKQH